MVSSTHETGRTEEIELQLADAVVNLLNIAVVPQVIVDGHTVLQCRLCGTTEDHAASCPVPHLELWLTS
jgi:hypothetical protein